VIVTHDVDEALYLADRVILFSHRPATISATLRLPFSRPRQRGDADLAALREEILTHFGFPSQRTASWAVADEKVA
jgi:NitT/TauT family transport system ATP-binding protein